MADADPPNVLNVGGTQVEIPIVIGKIEGRGNGIKTNVSNVVQISKIIKRHPAWTSKYLGCELGCVNSYDFDSGYSVLTGKHEDDKLQKVFKKYIKDFVLCPKCKGLQTKLDLDKKNKVKIKCKACGHKAEVDQSHKVVKEIIKVPPGSEIMAKKEKGVKPQGKKSRRSALKEGGDTEALDDEEEGGDAGGDAADDGGISAAAAAADAAEDEDEEAKAARRKKEKEEKAARKQAKADKVAAKEAKAAKSAGKANAREEKAKRLAAEATGDEYVPPVAAAADTEPAPEPAAAASAPEPAPEPAAAAAATDDAAELRAKIDGEGLAVATSFWNTKCKGLPVESAVGIPFEIVFDADMIKQIKKFKRIFIKICGEGQAQAQTALLKCTAALADREAAVMAKLGKHLQVLYDEDLVEEETLNSWFASLDAAGETSKQAKGFITWLAAQEEESSEEESDED